MQVTQCDQSQIAHRILIAFLFILFSHSKELVCHKHYIFLKTKKKKMSQKSKFIGIVVYLLIIPNIICKMEDFVIDVNDILSENLMPTSFFMVENIQSLVNHSKVDENLENMLNATPIKDHGTFGEAYSTMGFHRQGKVFFGA